MCADDCPVIFSSDAFFTRSVVSQIPFHHRSSAKLQRTSPPWIHPRGPILQGSLLPPASDFQEARICERTARRPAASRQVAYGGRADSRWSGGGARLRSALVSLHPHELARRLAYRFGSSPSIRVANSRSLHRPCSTRPRPRSSIGIDRPLVRDHTLDQRTRLICPRTPLRRANNGGPRPRQGKNGEAGDAGQKWRATVPAPATRSGSPPRSRPSPSAAVAAAVASLYRIWGRNGTNRARREENG